MCVHAQLSVGRSHLEKFQKITKTTSHLHLVSMLTNVREKMKVKPTQTVEACLLKIEN